MNWLFNWIVDGFQGLGHLLGDLLQVIGWVLAAMVALSPLELVVVLVILARQRDKKSVTTTMHPSPSSTQALVVHLPGFGGDGLLQVYNVLSALHERGDVMAVHYDGALRHDARAFDVNDVVQVVVNDICKEFNTGRYKWVEFYGTSMGAKIAAMIAVELDGLNRPIVSRATAVDAPLTWKDLQFMLRFMAPVLIALPYIPWFNLLLTVPRLEQIIINMLFPGPKESEISTDITAEELGVLETSVKSAQGAKLTFCRDEVKVILRDLPGEVKRKLRWARSDFAFVRSTDDKEVTRDLAIDSWSKLLHFPVAVFKVDKAKHAAYGQNPSSYRRVFLQVNRFFNS